ncbi:hypothetical protein ACQKKX_04905 [Neorhizobium sp. NPDC001467]|uniref:hypothetical protein n=1 Tax=Neorhizobium sp. NPDC001467 TaxID=3390595 RepID=UPI003CFF3E1A
MELDIEIEDDVVTRPRALYHLTDSEIGAACCEAEELLASYGIDRDAAAAALGISPITLKAYSRGVATVSHRRMPAATLDRIRDLAVDAYWRAVVGAFRIEVGGEDQAHLTPIYTAHDHTGLVRARHPHPLRMREIADKLGGSVRVTWAIHPDVKVPPLDAMAALRSRWRIGVWQLRDQFDHIGRNDVDDVLCEIADCDRYSLWSFSTEYRYWLQQVTTSQVERLEAAVADIERGDEIQPFESAVAKAMAELEDF